MRCDQWSEGICRAIAAVSREVVRCPEERAENAGRECCHHPIQFAASVLVMMKRAGADVSRIPRDRLPDPRFTLRLFEGWKRRSR